MKLQEALFLAITIVAASAFIVHIDATVFESVVVGAVFGILGREIYDRFLR